tara:strand:- start:1902 stop:2156 length:255 start_codon:yes stop_codon:yes gene_type:complete
MFIANFKQTNSPYKADKNNNMPYTASIFAGAPNGQAIINGTIFKKNLSTVAYYLCMNKNGRTEIISEISIGNLRVAAEHLGLRH